MNATALFDLIDRLIETLPLTPGTVAKILDTRLVPQPAASSVSPQAFALSSTDPRYQVVDLRLPAPDIGADDGFLSVTLTDDDQAPDLEAVIVRFGSQFRADAPPPRFKPGTVPLYLSYDREWGRLSFGIGVQDDGRVMRFILEERGD